MQFIALVFLLFTNMMDTRDVYCTDGILVVEFETFIRLAEKEYVYPEVPVIGARWMYNGSKIQLQYVIDHYLPVLDPIPDPIPDPPDPILDPDPILWSVEVCERNYTFNLASLFTSYQELYKVINHYNNLLFWYIGTARAQSGIGQGYEYIVWGDSKELNCASRLLTVLEEEIGKRGFIVDKKALLPTEIDPLPPPPPPPTQVEIPSNYTILQNEYIRAGFDLNAGGVLTWLSFRGGDNIIDDSVRSSHSDRGREFQGVLWEGYPQHGEQEPTMVNDAFPPCWDIVNPTQAAGDWGRRYVSLIEWKIDENANSLEGLVKPYDYCGDYQVNSTGLRRYKGPYRVAVLAGRYPETGWWMRFKYILDGASVRQVSEFWHHDPNPRYVASSMSTLQLHEEYFQRPLVNEDKRRWQSHCSDVIVDSVIIADAPKLNLRLRFSGNAGSVATLLKSRFADYSTGQFCIQLPPGEAKNVWFEVESYFYKWVNAGVVIKQDTIIQLEDL